MKATHATPKQVPGKGWDVVLTDGSMLCEGRAPYSLAQAQLAASNANRDAAQAARIEAAARSIA